ncbi:MAG TPA: nucleotidyltransferase family protein [Thermoplasmata archaeon]|nr:nucleotidyltransferase family protein [Thermoplasmata archaeon]
MTEPTGLILSAGASERWRGYPKALAPVSGETALGRVIRLMAEAGVGRIWVVLGAHSDEIRGGLPSDQRSSVEWVTNPDWARGQTSSVHTGLRQVDPGEDVVLWPVDHPLVSSHTLPRLLRASDADLLAVWTIPEFDGRGGHPVILKEPAWRLALRLPPEVPLHRLIPQLGPQVQRVRVDDPGVVVNVNTPEDLERARGSGLPREV